MTEDTAGPDPTAPSSEPVSDPAASGRHPEAAHGHRAAASDVAGASRRLVAAQNTALDALRARETTRAQLFAGDVRLLVELGELVAGQARWSELEQFVDLELAGTLVARPYRCDQPVLRRGAARIGPAGDAAAARSRVAVRAPGPDGAAQDAQLPGGGLATGGIQGVSGVPGAVSRRPGPPGRGRGPEGRGRAGATGRRATPSRRRACPTDLHPARGRRDGRGRGIPPCGAGHAVDAGARDAAASGEGRRPCRRRRTYGGSAPG